MSEEEEKRCSKKTIAAQGEFWMANAKDRQAVVATGLCEVPELGWSGR